MSEVQGGRDVDPESGEKYKSLVRYSKPVLEPKGGKDKKKKTDAQRIATLEKQLAKANALLEQGEGTMFANAAAVVEMKGKLRNELAAHEAEAHFYVTEMERYQGEVVRMKAGKKAATASK